MVTRKPLPKRSVKMATLYRDERAPFVAKFIAEHPRCQFPEPCLRASESVHEVIRRSHGGALYPGQPGKRETAYMALCNWHHDWVTSHPAEAKRLGLEVR